MDYTPQLNEIVAKLPVYETYFLQVIFALRVIMIELGCLCGVALASFVLWRIAKKDIF